MEMDEFIRDQNIAHFHRLLKNNPSEAEREVLEQLLAEEQTKANPPAAPKTPES